MEKKLQQRYKINTDKEKVWEQQNKHKQRTCEKKKEEEKEFHKCTRCGYLESKRAEKCTMCGNQTFTKHQEKTKQEKNQNKTEENLQDEIQRADHMAQNAGFKNMKDMRTTLLKKVVSDIDATYLECHEECKIGKIKHDSTQGMDIEGRKHKSVDII